MWYEFPKLYLDLEFIGAKLKVTGPLHILVDYRKYSAFIVGDDEHLTSVLQDFEQFVQSRGLDLHKYQNTDIVQCGLQEHRNSHVYKKALKIAKERPNKLYLEFLMINNVEKVNPCSLPVSFFDKS
ncbi:Apoptotic protease-activating factor 1 [Zootermopsis nevadensis]|uniref:Apoptotic protease-activating factor 1 n=1 Tax=Zootermopsis nevadensis TaxID=136037 RepID=A0A067QWU1_ZOONE|nr:Apoptotic protease-activating factor 1 [Zootermopsis nevadensis]